MVLVATRKNMETKRRKRRGTTSLERVLRRSAQASTPLILRPQKMTSSVIMRKMKTRK